MSLSNKNKIEKDLLKVVNLLKKVRKKHSDIFSSIEVKHKGPWKIYVFLYYRYFHDPFYPKLRDKLGFERKSPNDNYLTYWVWDSPRISPENTFEDAERIVLEKYFEELKNSVFSADTKLRSNTLKNFSKCIPKNISPELKKKLFKILIGKEPVVLDNKHLKKVIVRKYKRRKQEINKSRFTAFERRKKLPMFVYVVYYTQNKQRKSISKNYSYYYIRPKLVKIKVSSIIEATKGKEYDVFEDRILDYIIHKEGGSSYNVFQERIFKSKEAAMKYINRFSEYKVECRSKNKKNNIAIVKVVARDKNHAQDVTEDFFYDGKTSNKWKITNVQKVR
ncbi:MAG: hypothetical protein ACTSYD_02375 [Candidatus Heimdallarchaeaceae archaeon]